MQQDQNANDKAGSQPQNRGSLELPPLSLYIHIPWCVKKCPYCDFNSHIAGDNIPELAYVAALQSDLANAVPCAQGRSVQSIFFGGGTPSLFSPDAIHSLLTTISDSLSLSDNIEITLEANPGASDQSRFIGYRQAGVNRLSLGAQSFNDQHLRALGRIHDVNDIHRAITAAQLADFDAINIDVMYGLPEQTITQGLADLANAVTLKPGHISWYELTIEANTAFYNRRPTLPPEDNLATLEEAGRQLLSNAGYHRYEVSAYSQNKASASTHNQNYWRFGDYIGIGAGAHGKISYPHQQRIERHWKTRLPRDYLRPSSGISTKARTIPISQLPMEFMMNALRLTDGVDEEEFERRTGQSIDIIRPTLTRLRSQGLLSNKGLCATELGLQYLDSTLMAFSSDGTAS